MVKKIYFNQKYNIMLDEKQVMDQRETNFQLLLEEYAKDDHLDLNNLRRALNRRQELANCYLETDDNQKREEIRNAIMALNEYMKIVLVL